MNIVLYYFQIIDNTLLSFTCIIRFKITTNVYNFFYSLNLEECEAFMEFETCFIQLLPPLHGYTIADTA